MSARHRTYPAHSLHSGFSSTGYLHSYSYTSSRLDDKKRGSLRLVYYLCHCIMALFRLLVQTRVYGFCFWVSLADQPATTHQQQLVVSLVVLRGLLTVLRQLGLASCLPKEEINEMYRRGKMIGDVYTAQSNSRITFSVRAYSRMTTLTNVQLCLWKLNQRFMTGLSTHARTHARTHAHSLAQK